MEEQPDTFSAIKKRMETAKSRPLGFRSLTPRNRWRSLFRQIRNHFAWLTVEDENKPDQSNLVALLTSRRKRVGDIPRYEKALLRRPVEERSEGERVILGKLFSGLRCFRRYPEEVREMMAGFVYFEHYGANRVISREGNSCEGMYFVLTGQLDQYRIYLDPVLGSIKRLVRTIGPGDAFGDMSLLHDAPRVHTTVTKTVVEVLLLQKRDFDNVLKASIMKSWEEIREAMESFPYFSHWGEVDLRETCILSKISRFKPGTTILDGQQNMTYFLLSGQCRVIQHLVLVPRASSGMVRYRCLPQGTLSKAAERAGDPISLPPGAQTHFMQVAFLTKGECFGVGENLVDRRVVADTEVTALLVPRFTLLQRGRGNIWGRIRRFLDSRYPSQEVLFKEFLNGRDWAYFRQDLVAQIMKGRPVITNTTVYDIPLSLRTKEYIPPEKHNCYELGRLPDPRQWRWISQSKHRAATARRIEAAKREYRAEKTLKEKPETKKGVKFAS